MDVIVPEEDAAITRRAEHAAEGPQVGMNVDLTDRKGNGRALVASVDPQLEFEWSFNSATVSGETLKLYCS